jgi:pSer/pThr/pTyr-binding forkhead associated (FHA) protein
MLPQDRKRDTTAMLGSRPSAKAVSSNAAANTAGEQMGERRFRATIINNGRHINLPLAVPVLIGRQDSARGFFPDLDLNNDGGYDSGVSRKHARISVNGEDAYVEDLESANGTFINDQRLQPRTLHRLKSADELRLGSLILRVEHI